MKLVIAEKIVSETVENLNYLLLTENLLYEAISYMAYHGRSEYIGSRIMKLRRTRVYHRMKFVNACKLV